MKTSNALHLLPQQILVFVFVPLILLLLLNGCGPIMSVGQPFPDSEKIIKIGETTRQEVHNLLGAPYNTNNDGSCEIYKATSDTIGFLLIIPLYGADSGHHYILITYDDADYVTALSLDKNIYVDIITIFAGKCGFFSRGPYGFGDQFFPSNDNGGEGDLAWARYLKQCTRYRKFRYKEYEGWFALQEVCEAAKQNHPCAFRELGNYFWEGSHDVINFQGDDCIAKDLGQFWSVFKKDNVKACLWYSKANNNKMTSWCRNALSPEQVMDVETLLAVWQPSTCEIEMAPYMCGSGTRSLRICE